jgi:hypothetical protein
MSSVIFLSSIFLSTFCFERRIAKYHATRASVLATCEINPRIICPAERRTFEERFMSNRVVVIIIALCVAGVLCVVACCGGIVHFGMGVTSEEVRTRLEADPRFTQHVGQVQGFSLDYIASFSDDEDDVFVYNVKGTKWSGRVTVKHETDDAGDEQVVWARFTLASGEKVELTPIAPDPESKPSN